MNRNKIKCWYCHKYFFPGRSLTNHLVACGGKKSTSVIPCSNVNVTQPTSNFTPLGYGQEENQSLATREHTNEEEQKNGYTLQVDFHRNFYSNNSDLERTFSSMDEQDFLLRKLNHYEKDTKEVQKLCSDSDHCQIDLLKRLKDLDCPMYAYDSIMNWALKWSSIKKYGARTNTRQSTTSVFQDDKHVLAKRRKTVVNQLSKRFCLHGLKPTVNIVALNDTSGSRSMEFPVTTFDFKEQLFSLLSDASLMQPENLVFDGSTPSAEPNFGSRWISELNHGSWYENAYNYYKENFGSIENKLICGIILSVDKTHTDVKGKLCLEPVKFSLTLFNTETRRKNSRAWRRLGYINNLDVQHLTNNVTTFFSNEDLPNIFTHIYDIEGETTRSQPTRSRNQQKFKNSDKKSMLYHKILGEILKGLKAVQNIGMSWRLKYPDGNYYDVKMFFPISMCVVDMKGGKQLCGMYDSYANISRPCISCNCTFDDLTSSSQKCIPVNAYDMKSLILNGDSDELKSVSQLNNKINVFFGLELCSWKYGIWGLCPSEVLHQFYEGIVDYVLNEFYQEVLTDKYRQQLDRYCQNIFEKCRNQSDSDYPKGNFILGINKTGRIKGTEKFASLFYLSLFLHMSISRTKHFKGKEIIEDEMKKALLNWRILFEDLLYYHDWLLHKRFDRQKLIEYEKKILDLFKSIKKLVHRKGLGMNIPKFHEFLHIIRDIGRFGPPRGYDTCGNEGFLHEDKVQSKHTQRRVKSIDSQTSNRHYEADVIDKTYKSLEDYMVHKTISVDLEESDKNDVYSFRGCFDTYMSTEDGSVGFAYVNKRQEYTQIINNDFSCGLEKFLSDCIFSLCQPLSDKIELTCFTTMVRKEISFRGISRDYPSEECGWAMVQWTDGLRQLFLCPAQIVMFVSFEKVQFRDGFSQIYPKEDKYVIIKSLNETPRELLDQKHYPLCQKCTLYEDNCYHCVSIDTLYDSAFVVPDLGSQFDSNKRHYLYVFPRYSNKNENEEEDDDNIVGWNRKF